MEVVNKKEDFCCFGYISIGDVFSCKNIYYMRIRSVYCDGCLYNAVNLNSGELTHIDMDISVVNVPGKFYAK